MSRHRFRSLVLMTLCMGWFAEWGLSQASAQGKKTPPPPPPTPDFQYEFVMIHDDTKHAWSEVIALNADGYVLAICGMQGSGRSRYFVWNGLETIYVDEVPVLMDGVELRHFRERPAEDEKPEDGIEEVLLLCSDMNNAGEIVGAAYLTREWVPGDPTPPGLAYRWTPVWDAGVAFLEDVSVPREMGDMAIDDRFIKTNNQGDILGYFFTADNQRLTFLRTEEEGYVEIVKSPAWMRMLGGRFIRQDGAEWVSYISGSLEFTNRRAYRFVGRIGNLANGWQEDLGTFRSDNSGYVSAADINDRGQIVGTASFGDKRNDQCARAYRFTDGLGKQELGTLSTHKDYKSSWAFGVNDLGDTVGQTHYTSSSARRPFLFTDELGMIDLTTLIINPPDPDTFNVGSYFLPYRINNAGDIAGPFVINYNFRNPPPKAFLLRRIDAGSQ